MGRSLPILGVPGVLDGGGGIDWLLRDEFLTNESAPLASPRICEPGPGTLTLVQNDGQFSISGGVLQISKQTTPVWGDLGFYAKVNGTAITRAAGVCLQTALTFLDFENIGGGIVCGYRQNAAMTVLPGAGLITSFSFSTDPLYYISHFNGSVNVKLSDSAPSLTTYLLAVITRTTGSFAIIKGGIYSAWTLAWMENITAFDPYPFLLNFDDVATADYLRVRQLPAPFDTDYGIAALDVNPGVSGTAYTAVANAIHDLTVTAPNPLANTCELRYRVLDDNNYWTAYFDAAGAFKLDSVSGGVATNRINIAAVASAGNTYTIRAICDGTKHNCYTLSGTSWTKRGSEVNVSHQDTQATVKPVAGTGWTLGRLTSWPRTSAAYAELDKV